MVPLLGTEFVPKADFSETTHQLLHAGRLLAGSDRGQGAAGRRHPARDARGALHARAPSTPATRRARSTRASTCAWSTARTRSRSVDQMSAVLRERLRTVPGITVTHVGLRDSVGGNKQIEFSLQGPDLKELERLHAAGDGASPRHPRPGRPRLQPQAQQADRERGACGATPPPTWAWAWRRSPAPLRTLVAGTDGGQLARARRPDLRRQRAPRARGAQRAGRPGAPALRQHGHGRQRRRLAAASCGCNQVAEVRESTGPNQINRRALAREVSINANVDRPLGRRGLDRHPQRAGRHRLPAGLRLPVQRLDQEHAGVLRLCGVGAGAGDHLHLHDPGQPVQELPAAAGADDGAAAHADRRGAGAADVRLDAVDVLDHRRRDADGPGDQERHPAGGLRHPRARPAQRRHLPACSAPRRCCWPRACGCARS